MPNLMAGPATWTCGWDRREDGSLALYASKHAQAE